MSHAMQKGVLPPMPLGVSLIRGKWRQETKVLSQEKSRLLPEAKLKWIMEPHTPFIQKEIPVHHPIRGIPMANRPRTREPSDELAEGKARTLGLRRQLLELEHRRRAGELVRAERVMKAVSGLSRMERDMWINSWSARSAPLIACDLDIRDDAYSSAGSTPTCDT